MPEGRDGAVAIEAFAERLRQLKDGTSHSFESLARRIGVSRSTLHRYCTGKGVPGEFATVERLARACKADRAALTELHRLWVLADEAYRRGDGPGPAEVTTGEETHPSPEPATGAGPVTEPAGTSAADPAPTGSPDQGPGPVRGPAGSSRSRRWLVAGAAAAVLAVTVTFLLWDKTAPSGSAASEGQTDDRGDDRMLFRDPCAEPITMGQHDGCVEELQTLLADRGVSIDIDAQFGPETLRRVTAFQVLAGLPVNGVVGDGTKEALYESDVSMTSWSEEQVVERIREVFPGEAGDQAVRISGCQSLLDPLYVLANENGTRNWGLFQISDSRLRDLGGTQRDALDPEWNIRSAYRLWAQHEDFRDWPFCLAALDDPDDLTEGEADAAAEAGADVEDTTGEEPEEGRP
ncbi:helix-turn-helix domain-containing protein [Streptomyces sp. AA0539]|uniref:helix-turn-helix domain-containing protein n=1 Tax=Streptomyces sp. AA0539 TaxID=1210045 RepID=UPI000310998E|nr:helix-turn-helix domain-containing protein [Streptomyces sp. AA0539]